MKYENVKNIVNLTPHAITIVGAGLDGKDLVIEPSGELARVAARTEVFGNMHGIPLTHTVYGEVEGLPDYDGNTVYIVSSMVASRAPYRDDIFIPNESVRDEAGRIIGCKSLGRI